MNKPSLSGENELIECFKKFVGKNKTPEQVLRLAKRNGVGYLIVRHEEFHQRFWRSVAQLEELLARSGIKHLFIKTHKAYPYDDSNIDVVCRSENDFRRAVELARRQGRQATKSYHEPDKVMFRKIESDKEVRPSWHLHRAVTWNGVPYLDNETLFENCRWVEYGGATIEIPSVGNSIIINAGHALFENYNIPLGELFDTAKLSESVGQWETLFLATRRHGWENSFKKYLGLARAAGEALGINQQLPAGESLPQPGRQLPLPVPLAIQTSAFYRRIIFNIQNGRNRQAIREIYAYPTFYLIKKLKELVGYE